MYIDTRMKKHTKGTHIISKHSILKILYHLETNSNVTFEHECYS